MFSHLLFSTVIGTLVVGKPIVGKLVVSKPIVGKAVVGKPVIGKPVVGKFVVGKPRAKLRLDDVILFSLDHCSTRPTFNLVIA